MLMRNGTAIWNGQHAVDRTLVAMQEMERYCAAHPQGPAALRAFDAQYSRALTPPADRD
jgi:hypothetical protein